MSRRGSALRGYVTVAMAVALGLGGQTAAAASADTTTTTGPPFTPTHTCRQSGDATCVSDATSDGSLSAGASVPFEVASSESEAVGVAEVTITFSLTDPSPEIDVSVDRSLNSSALGAGGGASAQESTYATLETPDGGQDAWSGPSPDQLRITPIAPATTVPTGTYTLHYALIVTARDGPLVIEPERICLQPRFGSCGLYSPAVPPAETSIPTAGAPSAHADATLRSFTVTVKT